MHKTDFLDKDILARFAPNAGERPLLPTLSPRAQVALMCRMLASEGWNEHIAGHITVRQPEGTILANPWELAWDELRARDIVELDKSGNVVNSRWNISPAIGLHLQIHELRPEVNVVIHNHPQWSGIWANLKESPPVYDQAGAYCGAHLPVYDEYQGTFENQSTSLGAAEALGSAKWALLANHGALVVGENLRQAHLRVATLEWRSKRAWEARVSGSNPSPLPDDVVESLSLPDRNGFPFLWEAMARRELARDPDILDE